MTVGQGKQDKMPPSPRLLHSKFEYSLRSVSGPDVTALNIMSDMNQFNMTVVSVDFLLRLIERCPMKRRVRIRVGVWVAIMMDVGFGASLQNQVQQRKARGGIKMVGDKHGCG